MRQFIDRGVLANLISMLRADVKGAIWLADADDEARFYQQCAHSQARVLPAHGDALALLAETHNRGLAGIVATIRTPIEGNADENVFRPDVGDAASLAIKSAACEKVLRELAGSDWWRAAEREIESVTERSVSLAWYWERILEASGHSGEWPENTIRDAIDWSAFVLLGTFSRGRLGDRADTVLRVINERDRRTPIDQKLAEIDGRNAIRVIAEAAVLYAPLGIRPQQTVDVHLVISMLNVAFELEALETDPVFWRMRRWERKNRRFPLLRVWRVLDPFGLVWDQRYWRRDLEALLKLHAEDGLAAFKMDLDNFRHVNEMLGHAGGDEAIREYLRAVQTCLGGAAEVYRRGGDEVVAFAPCVNLRQAEVLAEELRAQIETRFQEWGTARGLQRFPTASIGVVEISPGMTADRVEELMEQAQWQAKNNGKNCVVSISTRS